MGNILICEQTELSAGFQAMAHKAKHHREAVEAFIDKRPPVFLED